MGFIQRSPLRRHHNMCPVPTEMGLKAPTLNTDRPCRFSRLRRFTPHTASRACCISRPTMGFARFQACRRHCCRTPNHPTYAVPSERFPSFRPNLITPTLLPGSLKPVPLSPLAHPAIRRPLMNRNLRGLTLMKSVAPRQCCHLRWARCSHGLLRPWAFTLTRNLSRMLPPPKR